MTSSEAEEVADWIDGEADSFMENHERDEKAGVRTYNRASFGNSTVATLFRNLAIQIRRGDYRK